MKHVLILGAHSDMAQALAHVFAEHGYSPVLAARHSKRLNELARDLEIRYQVKSRVVEFDVCDTASHQKFYDQLDPKPDVTLCVVGYLGNDEKLALTTNLVGPVSILHIVAADYEKKGAGCIVGISSVAGDRGRQSNYMYGSAKAGFTAFLSGLRNRLAKSNVHVMTVKPGFVRTKMTEGMKLPPVITASPQQVARDIYRAYTKRKDVIYTLWMWRYVMLIVCSIPERIFKKLKM